MIISISSKSLIRNFTIFGERHSGTNFLQSVITKAYNLDITWDYGWKHFFGFTNKEIIKANHTLFIGITRNPYDWIMAMKKIPHHIPSENQASLEKLLTKQWYSIDANGDEMLFDRNYLNHQRYKDIFELRSFKNKYLIYTMPKICKNYILLRYEDLLHDINSIMQIISNIFRLKIENYEPKIKNKNPYVIPINIEYMISERIDWKTEYLLMYNKKHYSISDTKAT